MQSVVAKSTVAATIAEEGSQSTQAIAVEWQQIQPISRKQLLAQSIRNAAKPHTDARPRVHVRTRGGRGDDDDSASEFDASSRTSGQAARDQWDVMSIAELMKERTMFSHLGLADRTAELDSRIDTLKAHSAAAREAARAAAVRARLAKLDAQNRKRMSDLQQQHEWEISALMREQEAAREALAAKQLRECERFAKRVQGSIATGGVVERQVYSCGCTDRYACPHNRVSTASGQRRRPNKEVVELRETAEKLRVRKRLADADELEQRAQAIDDQERSKWCAQFEEKAMGDHGDSIMSKLVARHDTARDVLLERQRRAIEMLHDKHASAMQTMPISFEGERRRVLQAVRKSANHGKFDDNVSVNGVLPADEDLRHPTTPAAKFAAPTKSRNPRNGHPQSGFPVSIVG